MKTEYLTFTDEMIPDAGKLLARVTHAIARNSVVAGTRFEDPQVAAKAIEDACGKRNSKMDMPRSAMANWLPI